MGKVIRYEACPKCRARGNDNSGDNLACYDDGGSYCFSCGFYSSPRNSNSISNLNKITHYEKAKLPNDFTWEVPTRAWKWLIQFGLPISYWQECTGYSPAEDRLIFRVPYSSHRSNLAFSIGRWVGETKEGKSPRKWYAYGEPHKHAELLGKGPTLVVVEDLISAHKVANAGFQSLPLFGTKFHPCHLYSLLNSDAEVAIWLDKDQEFNVKRQALRLESLINKSVKVIITDKDPKCLNISMIKNEIVI